MNIRLITFALVVFYGLDVESRILGVCLDPKGCNSCAGYSWCEFTQKCIQIWNNDLIHKCGFPNRT